jgi:Tol biopolymer transport system component
MWKKIVPITVLLSAALLLPGDATGDKPSPPPPAPPPDPAIAFVTSHTVKGQGYYDLKVMNADGSNQTVILTTETWTTAHIIGECSWSPDLSADPGYQGSLAFMALANGNVGLSLWVIDVSVTNGSVHGGTPRNINAPVAFFRGSGSPAWSPDGRWVAVFGTMTSNSEPAICLLPAFGDDHTPVQVVGPLANLSEGIWCPAWSPDGKSIAFMRYDPHLNQVSVRIKQVLDDDGTPSSTYPETTLVDFDGGFTPNSLPQFDWSRSGQWIAFRSSGPAFPDAIYAVKIDDRTLVQISGTLSASSPTWSPDDSSLVYESGGKIVRLDMATGAVTVLATSKSGCRFPDWRRSP